jgi:maleamate amidohydrolase
MARGFEDHCWQDVVGDEIKEIYKSYERDIFVGEKPAVLAIDLYKSAYRGGAKPVAEANREYPGSCGENAWAAVEPTQRILEAARAAGVPVIYTTRSDLSHKVNLFDLHHKYADVMHVEEVLDHLESMRKNTAAE